MRKISALLPVSTKKQRKGRYWSPASDIHDIIQSVVEAYSEYLN